MNPINTHQQHPPVAAQYYITGMPPIASNQSILKPNASTALTTISQQVPNIVTAINNVVCGAKVSACGNTLLDTANYVTSATNYLPVLLTNQTLISSVDPAKCQQQQNSPKIAQPNTLTGLSTVVTTTSSSNINIPSISNNTNKSVPFGAAKSGTGNITYQVLSSSQNNSLNPVITAPNGTVSVLLPSNQPLTSTGHSASPIIIRNSQSTANKPLQIKQQTQLQSLNAEMLKQIVGSTGSGISPAPGTTLLKPTVFHNKSTMQQKQQQQQQQQTAPTKTFAKNTKMIVTNQQQPHQLRQSHTIITPSPENSSQMLATSNATNTVKKLPQVSLLQNSDRNSEKIYEPVVNSLSNSNEIKVVNLNSEVSLIKKSNVASAETKSKDSFLKSSNKIQNDVGESRKQDLEKFSKNGIKAYNRKEIVSEKETNESGSLLKSRQDLKKVVPVCDISSTFSNEQAEKQPSLLKTQISNKKKMESTLEYIKTSHLTSPRSQRSNSYNSTQKPSVPLTTPNSERRHSEPSKIEFDKNLKMSKAGGGYVEDMNLLKSQELEIFFEDEEYLESSGDKSPTNSESYNNSNNKSTPSNKEIIENSEFSATTQSEVTACSKSEGMKKATNINLQKLIEGSDNIEAVAESKSLHTNNDDGNSSGDDDVTILPPEEIEIEQIEIDDDDDDNGKDITTNNLRPSSEDKNRLNVSLLCDEQFLVSSSSSISNNSSDQSLTTSTLIKSPHIDHAVVTPLLKKTLMEPKVFNQKEEPQPDGYSSVLDMLSNFNMLSWRERIGSARGTKLQFQLNEFNLIQLYEKNMPKKRLHTAYEKPISERESSHKKQENKEPIIYYMCRRCNVQGPSVDFLAPEFCSSSCLKRDCRKRRDDVTNIIRKRSRLTNANNFTNKISNSSNINESLTMNNPPPLTYIRKPKFRWTTYMNRNCNVIAAPISLFLNPFPTGPNSFTVGMKLEAIDPENCSLFCVCTVINVMGYRLKLQFDGYSSAYDFWLNADSMDIFPPGWCAKTNRILQPPRGITPNKFNWSAYLSKEKALSAPRHLFTHLNSSSTVPNNPFKIGMHLEAEDLNDTGKLCVASIADVLDDRIRIHFDGWDDCYDIIVDINSPYIHPCGWHEGRQQLVVPPDCENTAFSWNNYIQKQGRGEAAGKELFVPRSPIVFQPNMRLEVVDPRNPSLIRPATVISHKGHRVKLHLDAWPSDYCFWLEDDSPDLHPIGWCDATGHDLEPPPGFQISKQKMPCPVDGCRGIGNAKNAFKSFHAGRDCCPYAAENWRTVVEKPPRVNYENIVKTLPKQGKNILALQARLSDHQILDRLQMLDNIKTRNIVVKQDKLLSNHVNLPGSFSSPHLTNEENKGTKLGPNFSSTSALPSTSCMQQDGSDNKSLDVDIDIAREYLVDYGPRLQQNFTLWQKNLSFDTEKIKSNPLKWSTTEVSSFVDLHLNCRKTATIFNDEDIDGEAFLLLQQHDLTEKLGLKLGPAVKLHSWILQLRTLAVTKFEVPYKQ